MQVPFFPYKNAFTKYQDAFQGALKDIIESGQYIFGDHLVKFENSIAEYTKSKYCLGIANATDGLEMMMQYMNLKENDEVILSSHTMVATLSAIIHSRAKPVPVDIQLDGTISLDSIKKNINLNTKALIVTQLNGHTCKMNDIQNLCDENNIQLFEDSAQALGSKYKNQSAGTFGIAGCLSFYPAKILGGPGDGGALLTSNEDFYQWSRSFRDHGRSSSGIEYIGRNSRLDNLMAAFLNIQLRDFEAFILRRKSIAKIYNENLSHIKELNLPLLYENSDIHYETFQNYEILCEDRDELKNFLSSNNIGSLIQWGGVSINNIKNYGNNSKCNFEMTLKYFNECLMLPMNTLILDNEIYFIIEKIKEFYK